ncbi:MAG: RnfABCDGE type electron transport complex subunit A [Bryobacteraceae bacterium]|nr:RnfABCDGE type electron transport complex subunit A [Bryobacteraceae bacterium]MDW8379508.1 RnfABCDGE type electron transport complex subunit A [Bryobacterales bacterium]
MNNQSLGHIFIDALLINNFVLSVFLGICPFIGVSAKLATAWRMGVAVIFVTLVSSLLAYGTNALLVVLNAEYLRIISFIVIIASTVQLVEMFIKKTSPALFRALGIYLPLITTNCAVLGVALFQTSRQYDFAQSVVFAAGASFGFTIALVLMAVIREKLELSDIPDTVRGTALVLLLAGILSLAFMGFSGMGVES